VRADRLVAILLLLQSHGQLTAGDLAERLETSERTIRRDLDSLSAAGVPVYAQRGRGGGWALLGGHKLNLSGLTSEEAEALFMVAGPEALGGLGVQPGVRSALRKLLAALPAPLREQAAAAGGAVHVDPVAWGRQPAERPRHLDALRQAVIGGRQVDLSYAKPGDAPAERRVHPFGLVAKSGTWYLIAGTDAGLRTFRVSRVRGVVASDDLVERPEDFDLAQAWDTVVEQFPHRTNSLAIELEADPGVVPYLTSSFETWTQITSGPDTPRGWKRFTVMFPNRPAFAANRLAAFGSQVRVLSPESVRSELARIGTELVATYALATSPP
jgi:predicted DNA-binding transcriptional regulator YafY